MRWVLICLLAATGCQSCVGAGYKSESPMTSASSSRGCGVSWPDAGTPSPPPPPPSPHPNPPGDDGYDWPDGSTPSCVPQRRCYETGTECEAPTDAGLLRCVCLMSSDTYNSMWRWSCDRTPLDLSPPDPTPDLADED